ncbi:response regulator [Rhabdochromatium marinum]|uniref:response regulator n=1 Tax=Rhabdochromatium marinum TaxID=48729 RepID=UPI00190392F9|nr:response regulator [Rhabdochromatium marinum]MBK1650264.1 DNA-binding response regulator [Rhabdochromatium marinum]
MQTVETQRNLLTDHILIVDDDPVTCASLSGYFEQDGYAVDEAGDAEEARATMAQKRIDLMLLDVGLPGEDGFSLIREIRQHSQMPVIFVSSRDHDVDRILGLEFGADDYVVKPFNARELLVRARNLLRRTRVRADSEANSGQDQPRHRNFGDWSLDLHQRCLLAADGQSVALTRGEFSLLEVLTAKPGRALSRDALLDHLNNRDWQPSDRTVDVLISRLRRKLGDNPRAPQLIMTIQGLGYLFKAKVNNR